MMENLRLAGLDEVQIGRLMDAGYDTAPASKGHHLAYAGGLAEHSVNVTRWIVKLSGDMGLVWQRSESPYIVGMLHDVCKILNYRRDEFCTCQDRWEWVPSWIPGHGAASAVYAMSVLGIQLTPQEAAAIIWHMGAFCLDKTGLQSLDEAMRTYAREIICTHAADMMASQVTEAGK